MSRLHPANGASFSHSYYRAPLRNCVLSIVRCHFQWLYDS